MASKSSTSLAMSSIIIIFIVLFIAAMDLDRAPVRKPFSASGSENAEESVSKKDGATTNGIRSSFLAPLEEDLSNASEVEIPLNQDTDGNNETTSNINEVVVPNESAEIGSITGNMLIENETKPTGNQLIAGNISSELLTKSGFKKFTIRPIPFEGLLFKTFDISILDYLDIVEKKVFYHSGGEEIEVLNVFEFNLQDQDKATELYNYLVEKLKSELGVIINETNNYGLASFYINFQDDNEDAFLVVKTRLNVYALSYPKEDVDGNSYYQATSKLISLLE